MRHLLVIVGLFALVAGACAEASTSDPESDAGMLADTSSNPIDITVPDGCPDTACGIGLVECVGTEGTRRCADDGAGMGCGTWVEIACPIGEVCADGVCQMTAPNCTDGDSDGYGPGCTLGDDCDDSNPMINPGGVEVCDGVDNDCVGGIDDNCMCGAGTMPCGNGDCVDPALFCESGSTESEDQACGNCGTESRSRTCEATCTWGEWSGFGGCGGEGTCAAGSSENRTQNCGNCGTQNQTRTCTNSCSWGSWTDQGSCSSQGSCSAGDTRQGACDTCSQQTCTSACEWGACSLRSGNACEHEAGTNWRCCGSSQWQFCLPSCQWSTACASCTGCGC